MIGHSAAARLWLMRGAYVGLALVIFAFRLLPLNMTPPTWAGPDLLLAITFAWALRRPDYVPALSVALVMLMADLLFQRPPGLWAALAVIATAMLKARARGLRDQTFAMEWLNVAIMIVATVLGYRLILSLAMVPQAPIGLTAIRAFMTVLVYPLAVAFSALVFGVRKAAPGEVDATGQGA
ncbi:rod shape-determining protein MreD [Sediminimonas sp.]|uniref:rod shape-determining protein MreD n=1 Tax=Sediminimonas sp. TaxID=2823379 RepID=UPI0025F0A1BD|nr:rod shape-determining protein MreD [Sediminimonas sp.]